MMWDLNKFSGNIAVKDEYGTSVTYRELLSFSKNLSQTVNGRCLVFIMCRNSVGSIAGYVSCVNNNIVPVLLNCNIDDELFLSLVNTYKPKFIYAPTEQEEKYKGYSTEVTSGFYDYSLYKTIFDEECNLNEDLCLLLTTSGSTGSPKFVRQSYKNVLSNAKSIVEYLCIAEDERPITTLPMNYTYGLSIINSHILVGATLLVTDKGLMQKEFWNFFKESEATSFGGVPYTYEMLERLRFFRMNLPSLRYMTQAGGKLLPELHKKFAEFARENNKKFIVMYGQCEATARMGYLPYEKSVEKYGSMGIAIPGGEFSLIDVNNNVITEPGVTGELVYKGDNVTLGYAECKEDLSKGDERNGILYTGDMAKFDKDGFYYIVGRKKRFLKVYGNRVNLDEFDRLIKGKFSCLECACAGKDDHVYIFITDENEKENIKQFVSVKTKLNPAAFNIVAIEEIPKNESGKTLYRELEKYYL